MIIRKLNEIEGTDATVSGKTWKSRRLLLRQDKMGFSMHDTVLGAGSETPMWYKNHVEAVYCVEGFGEIEDLTTGEKHVIEPGTLYALDKNDRHILRVKADSDLRVVCVFNPPLSGEETHDEDGSYPLIPE